MANHRFERLVNAEQQGTITPKGQDVLDNLRAQIEAEKPPALPTRAEFSRGMRLGTQAVGRGLADLAGSPVDLMTSLLNAPAILAETGANVFLSDEDEISLPRIPSSVGGSEDIARRAGGVAEVAGFPFVDPATLSPTERIASNVSRLGASAVGGAGAGTTLSRGAAPAVRRIGEALTSSPGVKGLAVDTGAGAGAGLGLSAAEVVAPESPLAALVGILGGGGTGAKATQATAAPRAAVRGTLGRLPERAVAPDPATGLRPSRRTVDAAARIAQDRASDPAAAAGAIQQKVAEAQQPPGILNDPVPTAGLASDDIGLVALERGARLRDPVPFQESDQLLRDVAQERVTGLRDLEADPQAARQAVESDAAARRLEAEQPVTQARQELETLREDNARLASELETERAARLAIQDKAIAEQKIAKETAVEGERALGGEVAGKAGGEVAASERISGLVGEAKALEEATKAGLYKEATRLGKNTPVDPVQFADSARAVKAEISQLAQQDSSLNNILSDLDRLAPLDAKGNLIADAVKETTVADLIAMRPRFSAARAAAKRLKRGDVTERLDEINSGIKATLDDLAKGGDEAALAWRAAEKNFKENFAPKFRKGVGRELDVAERAGRPVEPSAVGAKLLKPGAGGKEAARDFKRILGGEGDVAAREFVLADMAKVVGADGQINPARLRTWITSREGMFQAQPKLRAEANRVLQDVINKRGTTTNLQRELERATAGRKGTAASLQKEINVVKNNSKLSETQKKTKIAELERNAVAVERDIQNSAAALLLETDPKVAARKVFSSNDPRGTMRQIVHKLKGDKEAAAGWKRAVVEHMVDRVTGTNTALTRGGAEGPVKLAALQKFFSDNERTLAQVFSPEEMNNMRRAHKILEPLGNLSRGATIGSQTVENQQLWNSMEAGLLVVTGNAITTGMIMKRIRVVLSLLPEKRRSVRLIQRMFFDPDLAALLLERKVNTIKGPAWNRKLTGLIGAEHFALKQQGPDDLEGSPDE